MSLILDALNKAEQERQGQEGVPKLNASHGPLHRAQEIKGVRRWLVEIVFVALLLIGVVLYYAVFANRPEALTQSPAPSIEHSADPKGATRTAPSLQDNETHASAARHQLPVLPPSSETNIGERSRDASIKALYAQSPDPTQAGSAKNQPEVGLESQSFNQSAKAAESIGKAPAGASASEVNHWRALPLLSELSPQAQNAIPSIDFSLHVFSAKQGTGFVTLNGEQLREGELNGGLRLVRIEEEFIVLDYEGLAFRLLSLNSWVNFESAR